MCRVFVDTTARRLHLQRRDDHPLLRRHEAEALAMHGLERVAHALGVADQYRQSRVGAVVAQVRPHRDGDVVLVDALRRNFGLRLPRQPLAQRRKVGKRFIVERCFDGLLAARADLRQPDAVGGQQPRQRMDQHGLHAERIGDQARVLPSGGTEAVERILGDVVAALHRDLLDGVRHVLNGDAEEAVSDLFRAAAVTDLLCQFRERRAHRLLVERLITIDAEDLRKVRSAQLADHHVGIGDGERPAAAVAFGPWVCARRLRADAKASAVVEQDRAAAGSHRVDAHHRHAHAHAGHLGLERALVVAGKVRNVRRRAAHVEADHLLEPGQTRGLRHAHHAAGGTGQDRIAALEQLGRLQAARATP